MTMNGMTKIHKETFLLYILKDLDSVFGPEARYPDLGPLWFCSVPPDKCLNSTLKQGQSFIVHHSESYFDFFTT
jgi:hypothetical protein